MRSQFTTSIHSHSLHSQAVTNLSLALAAPFLFAAVLFSLDGQLLLGALWLTSSIFAFTAPLHVFHHFNGVSLFLITVAWVCYNLDTPPVVEILCMIVVNAFAALVTFHLVKIARHNRAIEKPL